MATRMPVLFLGHGSPMNAVEEGDFTLALKSLGERLPRPRAIVCVSAHWQTRGSWVTHMPKPKTIHDFYGFPEELFRVQYPAPGSPEIAQQISNLIPWTEIALDEGKWGLDHGCWAVLKWMYPRAEIPVIQLSIDQTQSPRYHFRLGESLRSLREQGVLIVGSGNIVHNLREIRWEKDAPAMDWSERFDGWVKQKLVDRDYEALLGDGTGVADWKKSVPTRDHYDPMLYVLGASDADDVLKFEYEGIQNGSISMRSFSLSDSGGRAKK